MSRSYQSPQLYKSYCFFLDILGFSRELQDNCSIENLKSLLNALDTAKQRFTFGSDYNIKFFTDNIVIGFPLRRINELESQGMPEEEINSYAQGPAGDVVSEMYFDYFKEIIDAVMFYQYTMNTKGYFIRGGLANGWLYMDDDTVYGDSLIKAHRLEDECAVFPRILLSDELKEMVQRIIYDKNVLDPFRSIHDPKINYSPVIPELVMDEKGEFYINYLYTLVNDRDKKEVDRERLYEHQRAIGRKLLQDLDDHIKEKYYWSAFYHNWFCDYFMNGNGKVENVKAKDEWRLYWVYEDTVFKDI